MTAWTILEGDPAPGDVSAVAALARQFTRATEEFRDGQARISRMMAGSSASSWQGPAAAAFAGGLEPLRDDLGSAANSFEVAAAALITYGRVLDDLQTRARGLLAQANRAQQRIDEAERSLARTSSQVEQTIASQGLDPLAAMIYRRQTLAPHQQAVHDAEGWLRSVRSQAQDLRREHDAAARQAADGFGRATQVGIHQTFRDAVTAWAVSQLTYVNDVAESLRPNLALLVLSVAAFGAIVVTGGAAAPALALALNASAVVGLVDVGARIARRGLDDDAMTDSNAKLAVDLGLAALSLGASAASKAAVSKGLGAIEAVEVGGYTTGTYQVVNAAHQSMNQAILLNSVDRVAHVYELGVALLPRTIEASADTLAPSAYAPPVPQLTPVVTTRSVLEASSDTEIQAPGITPLQGSVTAASLQADGGIAIPGLQPVSPTVRMTRYQRPIELRE